MRRTLLPFLLCACLAPLPAAAETVVVFAASSLKTALDGIAAAHEAATGDDIAISYAGSNTLAGQILAGAPAEIFLSAAPEWMDVVVADGLAAPNNVIPLLGNSLVLVGPAGSAPAELTPALDLPALLGGGKLAMGLVDAVPAGQYGKAALTHLGLWDGVAPHVAQTDNVRAALALVATGEAPLAVTYASDALSEPRVGVIGTFPAESHPAIIYPAALLAGASPAAEAFFAALRSPAATEAFRAAGFQPLP